ncbi:hypothetical protein B0I37DRAFT_59808 [Chaetomium sp. MPI-CAGE-AT-0009]|nr:hypothetical protein B0I37DRAFT_59808 [Chaetomium sp. MPI-CAGE-AT-0009]
MRGGWGDVGLGWSVFEPSAPTWQQQHGAWSSFFPAWPDPGGTDHPFHQPGSTSLTTSDDDNCDSPPHSPPLGWWISCCDLSVPRNVFCFGPRFGLNHVFPINCMSYLFVLFTTTGLFSIETNNSPIRLLAHNTLRLEETEREPTGRRVLYKTIYTVLHYCVHT